MGFSYKTVMVEKQVVDKATCDLCDSEIPLLHALGGNPSDAATIHMYGWFGGFVDLSEYELLACQVCCESFLEWAESRDTEGTVMFPW